MRRHVRSLSVALAATVALLPLSACGGGAASGNPAAAADGSPASMLPKQIRDRGTLQVGGSTSVAPYLYQENGQVTGFEKDMMDAIGNVLGVKISLADTGFAALVPAVQSGRIDVAMGDFTDTAEREKVVDFIDYTKSFQALLVQKGNPKNLQSTQDLCGANVAAGKGSLSEKLANEQAQKCKDAGKPQLKVLSFEDAAASTLQVQNGRADAVVIDYVIAGYSSKQSGKTEVVGEPFYDQFHGAATKKGNKELSKALVAAFEQIIKDGSYAQILKKWDLDRLAMDKPILNGATTASQ
jgi:polar amino acid transport system substrate-binding protein